MEKTRTGRKVMAWLMALALLMSGLPVTAVSENGVAVICGKEEHMHSADCYSKVLTCGEEHEHTDNCYAQELSCGKSEHTHTAACYVSGEGDVTPDDGAEPETGCVCEIRCSADAANGECEVCATDITVCTGAEKKQAEEGPEETDAAAIAKVRALYEKVLDEYFAERSAGRTPTGIASEMSAEELRACEE